MNDINVATTLEQNNFCADSEIEDENTVLNYTFPSRIARIPEGQYPFVIIGVQLERNCQTYYGIGDKAKVTYRITSGTGEIDHSQWYIISKSKSSRFGKLIYQLTGNPVERTFNFASLFGISGTLTIVHNINKNGDVFENVSEIEVISNLRHGEL